MNIKGKDNNGYIFAVRLLLFEKILKKIKPKPFNEK